MIMIIIMMMIILIVTPFKGAIREILQSPYYAELPLSGSGGNI